MNEGKLSNVTKEELKKLIFEEKLSYEEIGRMYEVSGGAIKKRAKKLGIELPIAQRQSVWLLTRKSVYRNYHGELYKFLKIRKIKKNN